MIEAEIAGITVDKKSNLPIVLLQDKNNRREILPIVIGPIEAQAINQGLRGERFSRPLTHDLLINILKGLEVEIPKVIISSLKENTYYAKIFLRKGNSINKIDARPSDSLALASKEKIPIFIREEVMNKTGIVVGVDEQQRVEGIREYLKDVNPEDFGELEI